MSQLGEFDYGSDQATPNLEYKPLGLLETGAQYEGEYVIGTDNREGKGKQIWADGSVYEGNLMRVYILRVLEE